MEKYINYIVTHKNFKKPKNAYFITVKTDNKEEITMDGFYNDVDDNISNRHKNYGDLSVIYWVWKNTNNDIVGISHYRRYLYKKFAFKIPNEYADELEIASVLDEYEMIVPKLHHFRVSVLDQILENSIYEEDYYILRDVIYKMYPEYTRAFKEVFSGNETYLYNIFIAKREVYNEYCIWLFSILFEVEKKVDIDKLDKIRERIFGFMAERLFTVYIKKNNIKVREYYIVNTEYSINIRIEYFIKNEVRRLLNYCKKFVRKI